MQKTLRQLVKLVKNLIDFTTSDAGPWVSYRSMPGNVIWSSSGGISPHFVGEERYGCEHSMVIRKCPNIIEPRLRLTLPMQQLH